jgi:hypothetical protein
MVGGIRPRVGSLLLLLLAPLAAGQGSFGGVTDSLELWHRLDDSASAASAAVSTLVQSMGRAGGVIKIWACYRLTSLPP